MTDLVSLSDLQAQLQAQAETRLLLDDAYRIAQQTVSAYEADRAAKDATIANQAAQINTLTSANKTQAATIDFLNSNAVSLSDEIVGLLAQIRTLTQQVNTLNTLNASQGITITGLTTDKAALTNTVNSLTAQVAALTQSNTSEAAEIAGDNATIAALRVQVTDLTPDVTVTIGAQVGISKFETAISHVVSSDLLTANAAAKSRGMTNLGPAITYHQRFIMPWGSLDPWPWDGTGTRPAAPTSTSATAWVSMDAFMQMAIGMGGKHTLNTGLYSWHLKGKWMPDGTTVKMVASEAYSDTGMLLKSQEASYRLLIRAMATRYLAAPWNGRIFTTGVEFHGLYQGRQKNFNEWRWDDYPGTAGDNADMGMAYLHNITVDEITAAAQALSIDPASLVIIPNYPPLNSQGTPTSDSVPVGHLLRGKPWGSANKQPISILDHMLPLLKRYDAVSFDIALGNKDGVILQDDFAQLAKFDDMLAYAKSKAPGKPVAIMELYDKPQHQPATPQYRAALRAETFRRFVLGGVWTAFLWGSAGVDGASPDAALLTDTSLATGGYSTPMLDVVKLYHDYFGPGALLYDATVSDSSVSVLPSDKMTILINKTAQAIKVALGVDVYELAGYQVRAVSR